MSDDDSKQGSCSGTAQAPVPPLRIGAALSPTAEFPPEPRRRARDAASQLSPLRLVHAYTDDLATMSPRTDHQVTSDSTIVGVAIISYWFDRACAQTGAASQVSTRLGVLGCMGVCACMCADNAGTRCAYVCVHIVFVRAFMRAWVCMCTNHAGTRRAYVCVYMCVCVHVCVCGLQEIQQQAMMRRLRGIGSQAHRPQKTPQTRQRAGTRSVSVSPAPGTSSAVHMGRGGGGDGLTDGTLILSSRSSSVCTVSSRYPAAHRAGFICL